MPWPHRRADLYRDRCFIHRRALSRPWSRVGRCAEQQSAPIRLLANSPQRSSHTHNNTNNAFVRVSARRHRRAFRHTRQECRLHCNINFSTPRIPRARAASDEPATPGKTSDTPDNTHRRLQAHRNTGFMQHGISLQTATDAMHSVTHHATYCEAPSPIRLMADG